MTPHSLEEVLHGELDQIRTSRALRLGSNCSPAREKNLIGLAFSGGGIRSATFNLGVLQAFAQSRLLRTFDYLSTVSGGGYVGGWLMGWMYRTQQGIHAIEEQLSSHSDSLRVAGDPPPVHFLRNYSNYLTPRTGIFSADFWAFVAVYFRNTMLNLIILLLSLLGLLLAPRGLLAIVHQFEAIEDVHKIPFAGDVLRSQDVALAAGFLLGALAVVFMGLNLAWVEPADGKSYPLYTKQAAIQCLIVIPLFLSAAFSSYGFDSYLRDWQGSTALARYAPVLGSLLYFGMWACAFIIRKLCQSMKCASYKSGPKVWVVLATALATGALGGYLLLPYAHILESASNPGNWAGGLWHVMTFGTPALVGIMLAVGVVHIGLMGRGLSDAHREWWARLGGWLLLYSFFWIFLCLMAIYVPVGLSRLWVTQVHPRLSKFVFSGGALAWLGSTLYGILFGKSGKTGDLLSSAPLQKRILTYAARMAPFLFILGLLAGLSVMAAWIAKAVAGSSDPLYSPPSQIVDPIIAIIGGIFIAAAVIVSWRVDINEFSLHYFYRNRLVRCYLGASVPARSAQPFTGFSNEDDLPLAALNIQPGSTDPRFALPIPILNTSLNVVRGKELALQTRKARSFAFTPAFSGFTRVPAQGNRWQSAFSPTSEAGTKRPENGGGVTLGTAMAISGAAASPNMGYHSSPSLAFLMTLFDVRLGWWMGNPLAEWWKHGSPDVGFYWLLRELLGATNDDSRYVYLSDGGHFENLGIYELVRRQCRLIVCCDASCDPSYKFGDLNNAIERCRSDFGVEITLDTGEFSPKENRVTRHFQAGTIHYTPGAPEEDGVIIYLKPTLVPTDPCELLGYGAANDKFPHDRTADQWFDESQFENYRALGHLVGLAARDTVVSAMNRLLS